MLQLPLPPGRPLQQLSRPDLGTFAAHILIDPTLHIGRRFELASDDPTPIQMASALGEALGRDVRPERVPLDEIDNPDMRAMWTFLNGTGYRVAIADLHAARPEIAWTAFADLGQHTFQAAP